ncbi:hypothetical protein BJ508DRAFT_315692 [Ascobolus immersus RN42]|uniref:Uncharacterized protein n=1 Tax=Ascobolus immersus RN42 TaxID=1160509 RepID=A0A3N4HG39_ASCIM|nr:hypothetical protein BJ508DRAFT_315692 [Ascobolus immersus RN42]
MRRKWLLYRTLPTLPRSCNWLLLKILPRGCGGQRGAAIQALLDESASVVDLLFEPDDNLELVWAVLDQTVHAVDLPLEPDEKLELVLAVERNKELELQLVGVKGLAGFWELLIRQAAVLRLEPIIVFQIQNPSCFQVQRVQDPSFKSKKDGDDDEDYVEPARRPKRQTRLAGKGGRLSYAVPEGVRSELEAECDEVLERGAREVILWDGCKSTVGDCSTFVGVLAVFSDAQARCMELFGPSAISKILLDATRVMNRKLYGQELEKKRVKVEVIDDSKEKREKKTEVGPVPAILKLLGEMKEVAADWSWQVGWESAAFAGQTRKRRRKIK